jgi:lipoprotein-releasing system permease protein
LYKLLLCWRYLLTRYLAFACIISVMLGVATLIVVNSVMGGFSTKLKERLHGLLSDVLVEARNSYSGFEVSPQLLARVRNHPALKDKIQAVSPTLEVFAMLQYRLGNGQMMMRPIRLIGVDPQTRGAVGGFREHLLNPKNRIRPSFDLPAEAKQRLFRNQLAHQSREWRDYQEEVRQYEERKRRGEQDLVSPVAPAPDDVTFPRGIIVGNNIASFRMPTSQAGAKPKDLYTLLPGDSVRIITYQGADELKPASGSYVVCDYFKSEMSEYDSNYVFLPLDELQRLRGMEGRVTSLQIKLRNYADAPQVLQVLRGLFPHPDYQVETWEDKQGALLAAISIEKGILNVLLFLIIGVAGFGILAIFTMIVAEKTRDIGILKALGASNGGVMKIFLGYGLLLGVVGAGLGTALGLTITAHVNDIEQFLARLTGHDIFDRSIYYFDSIPTYVHHGGVVLVNLGAVAIAVASSVLPALRAAMLHPVRALRYE